MWHKEKKCLARLYQPHLFSRTRDLCDDFARALLGADEAIVTRIYPSREAPIAGVSGEDVVHSTRLSGHRRVRYCDEWKAVPELLAGEISPGDLVLTLGAGDIYRLGRQLTEEAP